MFYKWQYQVIVRTVQYNLLRKEGVFGHKTQQWMVKIGRTFITSQIWLCYNFSYYSWKQVVSGQNNCLYREYSSIGPERTEGPAGLRSKCLHNKWLDWPSSNELTTLHNAENLFWVHMIPQFVTTSKLHLLPELKLVSLKFALPM